MASRAQRRVRALITPAWLVALSLMLVPAGSGRAENIDPDDDGSQFAWSENAGWVNAQPSGPGGPGIHVDDQDLTGWAWSENFGWISLSCANTASCLAVDFGVTNDGRGNLAGWAWSENVGWISFSCTNTMSCSSVDYGVRIHPVNGEFSGEGWSENVGWLRFRGTGTIGYSVRTSWLNLSAVPSASLWTIAIIIALLLGFGWTRGLRRATLFG